MTRPVIIDSLRFGHLRIGALVMAFRSPALVLLAVSFAFAQSGVLTGIAVDSQHHPVGLAKVHLQRSGETKVETTQTDSAGVYRFSVTPGTYTLKADDDKFEQATAGPFTITAGKVTTIDLVVQAQYFDEPQFTVAGVTDNTYRGGHGADTVLRSSEALTKATADLTTPNAAERTGHPLEAVKQLQSAAEANPSEANLFNWGTELLAHLASVPAIAVFEKGVHLFPNSTRMLLGLGSARYTAGSYEQAANSFFRATDLDPADPKPYLFLAEAQRSEITQLPAYEERLARFAKLHPESALANYNYAVNLQKRHEDAKAVMFLKKVVVLDPHLGGAYLQLGIIHARQQNYSEAIREYARAIDVNPGLEEAHYRLSEAYRMTGDRMKAAEQLTLFNQLSKDSAEKLERERRNVQQFVIALRTQ